MTFQSEIVDKLTRTQIVEYAGASGDYNPLHTDELYATGLGYPSVFAHGMLTMAMTGRVLSDLAAEGRLLSFGGRFTAQVWPGDSLTTVVGVTAVEETDGNEIAEFDIVTRNQAGVDVFVGYATARADAQPASRELKSG